jgi:hypothetical protein
MSVDIERHIYELISAQRAYDIAHEQGNSDDDDRLQIKHAINALKSEFTRLQAEFDAEKEKNRWHNVKDELPEIIYPMTLGIKECILMMCISDGCLVAPVTYETDDDGILGYWYDREGAEIDNVTLWKPIGIWITSEVYK